MCYRHDLVSRVLITKNLWSLYQWPQSSGKYLQYWYLFPSSKSRNAMQALDLIINKHQVIFIDEAVTYWLYSSLSCLLQSIWDNPSPLPRNQDSLAAHDFSSPSHHRPRCRLWTSSKFLYFDWLLSSYDLIEFYSLQLLVSEVRVCILKCRLEPDGIQRGLHTQKVRKTVLIFKFCAPHNDRGEPTASYQWTGGVWE